MKPYYEADGITIYHGDCRESVVGGDLVLADPPYAQTSLGWDKWQDGWVAWAALTASQMWVFGTLRVFLERRDFSIGWHFAQDVIWRKHNGSSFHNDRFRRVHEQVAHFYHGAWADVWKCPQYTLDATKRTVLRKGKPPHMGQIGDGVYESQDGGPRLQLSVLDVRSCHGEAQNETQKPLGIVRPLIAYSCPPNGCVISPFMGSGTDLVAAKELRRCAIGFDIREEQCEIAAKRLSQQVLDFGGVA